MKAKKMIEPFEYCTECGLVYVHIQHYDCIVCHGKLKTLEGLSIPEERDLVLKERGQKK